MSMNVIFYILLLMFSVFVKAEERTQELNFKISAHVDYQTLDYGIRSVSFSPDEFTLVYDEGIEKFPDVETELSVLSNIKSIRKENFFYKIKIIDKESHCLTYGNEDIIYDSPKIYLYDGDELEITERESDALLLGDSSGDYKGDKRRVKMIFNSIPRGDFVGRIKQCSGEMVFLVGLSV